MHAARAAAKLKDELGVDSKLVVGDPGEFRVLVGDEVVAKKRFIGGIPSTRAIVRTVREKLAL